MLTAQQTQPFPKPASPGNEIQAATQAVAHDKSDAGGLEVLSDTLGVDFGPYLSDFGATVRKNWYALMPEDAIMKKGDLAIEVVIHHDGGVTAMHLAAGSGDVSLDRAAWDAIKMSIPFAPLPGAFTGPDFRLRLRFYYNPNASDFPPDKRSPVAGDPIVHAVLLQTSADSHIPTYPKKARKAKIDGIVRLDLAVGADGKVNGVKVVEGDRTLAEASAKALREWRFRPGQKNGKTIEDRVRVRVEFRLQGERVRAVVVWPEPGSTGPAQ